jgi:ParB-like chromosome segregation protein Spo0J
VIVDGEHRWRVSGDKEVAAMTGGKVPIVKIMGTREHRMMSTIRHNRARGEHHVLPMADIVRALLEGGIASSDVQFLLQMEDEEVERLAERAGMPQVVSRDSPEFAKGWVPG